MAKNINHVSHKKSKVKVNGKPQLPSADAIVEGEIAVNFGEGVETLSIKNESGDVVTFSSDHFYTEQKLGSAFTGENSAKTVTDVIEDNELVTATALNDLKENKLDVSAYTESTEYWTSGTVENSVVLIGGNNAASGYNSVAEGYNTTAGGNQSHAEGVSTKAIGDSSHAEGSNTNAIGSQSHAEGSETNARGAYSHAEGIATSANGYKSHAEGDSSTASGDSSHAEGYNTIAEGSQSHAEGRGTHAAGQQSHAEGNSTVASGMTSHAEGQSSVATGSSSHAEGYYTRAFGEYSHAEGSTTSGTNMASHAEGLSTKASGQASHAEGKYTEANGDQSHAEGYQTSATSYSSHAEGNSTKSTGDGSHAEGGNTSATSMSSHAEGQGTSANGMFSHAEGNGTIASGMSSHAEGQGTLANGYYSHTEGNKTITNNQSEHASGQYNVSNSASTTFGDSGNTLFSVGNGTTDDTRHNAFEIRQNGDIYIVSGNTDIKLQDHIGGGGSITIDPSLDSGSTNPVANSAITAAINAKADAATTYTKSETSGATELSTAFNAKLDASAYTPTDLSNYYTKSETSGATEISNALGGKVNSATFTGHTANTAMHFTTTEKTNLDSLATNIATISGITSTKVGNWDTAYTNNHTHSNKTYLDSITGNVGTMAYQATSSYSSATQVNTALAAKANTTTTLAGYGITDAYTKSDLTGSTTTVIVAKASSAITAASASSVAWGNVSSKPSTFTPSAHDQASNTITAMTGYAIASASGAVATNDTLNAAIGKLEKRIALLEAALGGMKLVKITQAQYDALTTKDSNTLYVISD